MQNHSIGTKPDFRTVIAHCVQIPRNHLHRTEFGNSERCSLFVSRQKDLSIVDIEIQMKTIREAFVTAASLYCSKAPAKGTGSHTQADHKHLHKSRNQMQSVKLPHQQFQCGKGICHFRQKSCEFNALRLL